MPKVNPDILTWARETAGLNLDDAAKAIGLGSARGKTGGQRLADLESGEAEPSRQQLARMAEKYRRPLISFYLSARPPAGQRGEDFRRTPKAPPPDFDPRLDALIRNVRARQDVVRFLLEDDESEPLLFVASSKIADGVNNVASSIVESTGFQLAEFRRAGGADGEVDAQAEQARLAAGDPPGQFGGVVGGGFQERIVQAAFRRALTARRLEPAPLSTQPG